MIPGTTVHQVDSDGWLGQAAEMERAVQIVYSPKYPVERIITHVFPLQEATRAMERFIHEPQKCIRTALVPCRVSGEKPKRKV